MITDNLASLFDQGQPGVRFRQGTVVAWNATTGANTIDVGGGTLTDVPILNTGEAIALKAGHIVGLLGQGSAWFIIGRITPSGDPNFASASVAFGSGSTTVINFALVVTYATKASVVLTVPSWADEAAVIATATTSIANPITTGSGDYARMRIIIGPNTGGETTHGFAPQIGAGYAQYYQALTASHSYVVPNPGPTLTVAAQIRSNGADWAAHPDNTVALSAMAIFRSTV